MGLLDFLLPKKTKYRKLQEAYLGAYDRNFVQEKWEGLERKLGVGTPSATREAVLEADKVLGYVLERLYPTGENLGERLKAAKIKFDRHYEAYDGLWYAHKIRNEMVHNVNFELPTSQARDILEKFKKGLETIGAL